MSTSGDIMSTSGDIMSTSGGYHEYIRGCSVHRGISWLLCPQNYDAENEQKN